MKKVLLLTGVTALLLVLALTTGCGGNQAAAQECAGCGMAITDGQARIIDGKAYCANCAEKMSTSPRTDADREAVHDCDGGCGMKDVPLNKLTEVNGKYYCQGCVSKMGLNRDGHGH